MKSHLITLIILNITIGITLAGCGGGEEDSGPIETVESPPAPVLIPEATPEVTKPTITTSELISEPDFDFISSTELVVTLPASPSTTVSYFINICTDFYEENEKVKINYDSCKLRTILSTLEQPFTLSMSNAESALVAQIWPIEEAALPVTIYWNIAESGNRWKIAI
ncbi:hypothetical protein CXF85_22185 [Colwellia sp. 75C3]|uniref:hypothetical protein n=1 Tax=Colwellia sp. 75C3 TaxID=888425 RepID=UPI000C334383|nr:hypothetical protein [Colwellia sp. 75C3]PKG80818.1 hypothetical protein CXF85_22185 [Colwellia sp. 75C3]